MVQFPIELLKLQNFSNEKVSISVSNFSIGNVNHVMIYVKVKLKQNFLIY